MFKNAFVSFIISLLLSLCIGFIFYPNWLYIIIGTVATYCIQLIITGIVNQTVYLNKLLKNNQLINERVDKIYSQTVVIQCSNGECNHKYTVPVWFDKENIQECPNCGTKNKILPSITVVKSEHDQYRN